MEKRKSILIVDDDRDILEMVKLALELEGCDVVTAADGETGLALMEKYIPNLVILDVMMPGLDGFQVLDIIRQRSDVPVIMLTARCEIPVMGKALILGADDYVRKPFSMRELLARIQAKLRRSDTQTKQVKQDVYH